VVDDKRTVILQKHTVEHRDSPDKEPSWFTYEFRMIIKTVEPLGNEREEIIWTDTVTYTKGFAERDERFRVFDIIELGNGEFAVLYVRYSIVLLNRVKNGIGEPIKLFGEFPDAGSIVKKTKLIETPEGFYVFFERNNDTERELWSVIGRQSTQLWKK